MDTPIYNKLRRDGHYLFHQCEGCKAMGWPQGTFECVADNFDCIDYYDPPIQPTKPMSLNELREALSGNPIVTYIEDLDSFMNRGVIPVEEARRILLG